MAAPKKEFVLTHVFKNVSSMKETVHHYSPTEERFEFPWKIDVVRKTDHVGLYLRCEKGRTDNDWSIETWFEIKLSGAKGNQLSKNAHYTFGSKSEFTGWGYPLFTKWDDIMEDYVIDDTLKVEIRVKIPGIPKKNLMSFDESRKQFSDVALIVENRKFYVLKLFLASQSTFFEALFLRNFEESTKPEVTLSDVNAKDFQNFLELFHGESPIDDSTVDGILHLADMYDATLAIRKCEQFLIENSEKTLKEKLQLAHCYDFKNLKDACLSKINTAAEIRLCLTDDTSEMDPAVLGAFLHKLLALHGQ